MAVLTVSQLMEALLIRELLIASNTLGTRTAARMAMTASTSIISINVKPCRPRLEARLVVVDCIFIRCTFCFSAFYFLFLFCFVVAFGAAALRPQLCED